MEAPAPTLTPPERFTALIEGLYSDITAQVANGWVHMPLNTLLITLIWRRLRRMSRRFAATMAQLRAGTLPPAGPQAGPQADSAPDRPARVRAAPKWLPIEGTRRFGWAIYAVSWFLNVRHFELKEMLEDPATEQLVADAPQLGSVLRPLCQMLAVKPPAWLRRPRRPRRPRVVAPVPPAPEWLLNEPGAMLHSDGTVWMRLGASTRWRPGDPITLEEAQKFDRPRCIWPHRD